MTEIERLKARLFGGERKITNFHFTPGPLATPETVAREINRAFDQIEAGDYELVSDGL